MQHTSHLLMIRPVQFAFNAQTAVNNSFQVQTGDDTVQEKAAREFDIFVTLLRYHGIDVTVIDDTPEPHTPDSVFPNNWISFHEDGTIYLYPMFAVNRRLERKQHIIDTLKSIFHVSRVVDLTGFETNGQFLEGTGSMVLDRDSRTAFACLSPRTDRKTLLAFCEHAGYRPVLFSAFDAEGEPIYHTNVMMCVADAFALICIECIPDTAERENILSGLSTAGKEIITISREQMDHFAGNMLQVHNADLKPFLVMSSQAYESLTIQQRTQIQKYSSIIHSDITTIETHGGGSARCMIAEVFLGLLN